MKSYLHRAAAVALAVALSFPPTAAFAVEREKDVREKNVVVRIVKKIQKVFGIATNDDIPLPPYPKP